MEAYIKAVKNLFLLIIVVLAMTGCGVNRYSYNHMFTLEEVSYDYHVFENILKESHPGLYWYTPRDSMDYYFRKGEAQLKDSMTESQFRKVLSYVVSKIDCGHTSVKPSNRYIRHLDSSRLKIFPLSLKLWDDTATVSANLNRKDSILKRGTVITAVDNRSIKEILDTVFQYLPADGYNRTHKLQVLSNRASFGSNYTSLFGTRERFLIDYTDSSGAAKSVMVPVYNPLTDSVGRPPIRSAVPVPRIDRKERELLSARQLRYDMPNKTAIMDVNSFSRGYRLKRFFRRSFREIRKNNIDYLVIDVRANGGGNVMNSTLLTKFLINSRFKLADSLYAFQRNSSYGRRIQNYFFNRVFMTFVTKKKPDGHYHFGYFERHYFKPKKKNHFDGKTYVLIGGNSFSATSLFAQSVRPEANVTIVGEETGGGAYGNSAWLIPDVTLPETKVRFRLPLFRLVINKDTPKNGRGVQPEVEVKPTVKDIRNGVDFKMNKVIELINQERQKK